MTERPCVLVVEDEPALQDVLAAVLEADGYAVARAGTVAEAEQVMGTGAPAALVLDVQLPGASGLTLLERWITAGRPLPPVVVISGYIEPGQTRALTAAILALAPEARVLSKPFDVAALEAAVRAVLAPAQAPE